MKSITITYKKQDGTTGTKTLKGHSVGHAIKTDTVLPFIRIYANSEDKDPEKSQTFIVIGPKEAEIAIT